MNRRNLLCVAAAAAAAFSLPSAAQPSGAAADPVVIYFDWDRSDITPQAAAMLDRLAGSLSRRPYRRVTLVGHSDREHSAHYAMGLSRRRAASARAYLIARGLDPRRIVSSARGSTRPAVPTAAGVREPQNRRVEISVAW